MIIEDGAGGVDEAFCYPGVVCFASIIPTPGLSFTHFAFAFTGASSDGVPTPANEGGVVTASVSYPKSGTVCMSGDDGAGLGLQTLHAGERGIAAVSFAIETPPSTGVTPSLTSFDSCGFPSSGGVEEQDGQPLVITSSGTTTTLSLATDLTPLDQDALGSLWFVPGSGEYDFCVTDLKFLDAKGAEVRP